MGSPELTLRQGISTGFAWPVVAPSGQPASLTDYTARCKIDTTNGLVTLPAYVADSKVVVSWTEAESRAWAFEAGTAQVVLVNPSGVAVLEVYRGPVRVQKAIA